MFIPFYVIHLHFNLNISENNILWESQTLCQKGSGDDRIFCDLQII